MVMKVKWILSTLLVYLSVSISSFGTSSGDEKEKKSIMTVNISGKLRLCSWEDKGFVFVDVKGGNPPYSITSKNKPAGQILDNLNSGSYTIFIEDKDGNKIEERFIVQPPMPLIVEMEELYHANKISGKPGSAKINLKFITDSDVKVEWSNGLKNVLEAENLKPGTYSVRVYDVNGCDSTVHFEIKEQETNPEFSFSLNSKQNTTESKKEESNSLSRRYTKEELKKIAEEIMATMDNK
jgi:uncharacterized protein (DUF2141 family)